MRTLSTVFLLYVTVAMAYAQHPLQILRRKEPPTDTNFVLFPVDTLQPKPIEDDCMTLRRLPSGRDLDTKRLSRRLGGMEKFAMRYLSVSKPQSDEPEVEEISLRRIRTADKNVLKEVIRNETKHMPGIKGRVSLQVERFMMKWLVQKSFCPVQHVWQDMGLCFWPRWLAVSLVFFT